MVLLADGSALGDLAATDVEHEQNRTAVNVPRHGSACRKTKRPRFQRLVHVTLKARNRSLVQSPDLRWD